MGVELINTHTGKPLATYPEHCYIGGTTKTFRAVPSPSLPLPDGAAPLFCTQRAPGVVLAL